MVATNKRLLPQHLRNRYPVYIISKGRWENRYTSWAFEKMGQPHFIAVETHEYDNYVEATKSSPWVTILKMPFSNHGKGSGPARNWIWEHSITHGFERHWCFDDNIFQFWRFYNNTRFKMETPAFLRSIEDYVDRFDNVMISGLQYKFFCMDDYPHPPYIMNTRIMSAILLQNNCRHRWRGRYNEDVDLSLRILKDGDCSMLFYNFLAGKAKTQSVKGGNTTEIYGEGTLKKSQMLVDMHPDVVELKQRYGRWHHHVDISSFRSNRLIVKPESEWPVVKDPEYGLALSLNWDDENFTFRSTFKTEDVPCLRKDQKAFHEMKNM